MEKQERKINLIKDLEYEIKKGYAEAINEFINYLEKNGTPLIDELEDDKDNCLVTFIYVSHCQVENVLFLSGILLGLDKCNLEEHKMENINGTDIWYCTYKVRNDINFSYYFFPNDSLKDDCEKRWDNMIYDKFSTKKTIIKGLNGDSDYIESACVMPKYEDNLWLKFRNDVPKGLVEEYKFQSENYKNLSTINIYTPYGYKKDDLSYGFVVLTDGCDYIHTLSAINVLDNLIGDKKIPPIIAIFVDPFEVRNDELSCNDRFCNTIVNELIPWVREKYNISNIPTESIIGGLSLGGLTATYIGLNHSEVFGNVLSQSGSYWYKPDNYDGGENDCWMSTQFKLQNKLPLKFYLNVGILENRWMTNSNNNLKNALVELGYNVDFEMFKSGHDYLSWGQTLANGLISLIGT